MHHKTLASRFLLTASALAAISLVGSGLLPSHISGSLFWQIVLWVVVVVGAACPFFLVAAVWLWVKSPKDEKHICVNCGYNLTGNVSGTCPECGIAVMQPDRNSCVRFAPSRVDGTQGVKEVAVYPDRLEVQHGGGLERFRFDRMAAKRIRWRHYLRLKLRGCRIPKTIAERDCCQKPCFFRFYTKPPITIYMPEGEDEHRWFDRVRDLIHSGRYSTFDLT